MGEHDDEPIDFFCSDILEKKTQWTSLRLASRLASSSRLPPARCKRGGRGVLAPTWPRQFKGENLEARPQFSCTFRCKWLLELAETTMLSGSQRLGFQLFMGWMSESWELKNWEVELTSLGVDGIGHGHSLRLYPSGWKTIAQLYNASAWLKHA